jgi:hypothetical protein
MIRYKNHSIYELTHIETGKKYYELSHWYSSDKSPEVSGRRLAGIFESYQDAEDRHNEMMAIGLLKDER